MYTATVIIIACVLGGLCLYISAKLLKRLSWVLPWFRGSIGLFFLLGAVCIGVVAWDMSHYDELLNDRPIASISFAKNGDQSYTATVSYYEEKTDQRFDIYGDQWQVDAKIFRWTGFLATLGAKPGYRLDRISGRYLSLEDERNKPHSVHPLNQKKALFDIWSVMQERAVLFPGIDAVYGSAAYLPMADSATYQLSLSQNGLTATPVNEIAKAAIKYWR